MGGGEEEVVNEGVAAAILEAVAEGENDVTDGYGAGVKSEMARPAEASRATGMN